MKLIKYIGIVALGISLTASLTSCKKDFLDTKPNHGIDVENGDAINSLTKASALLTGTYDDLSAQYGMGAFGIIMPDLLGEDILVNSSNNYNRFTATYGYNLLPNYNDNYYTWAKHYVIIKNANVLIDGVNKLEVANIKDQGKKIEILSQARAIRAYSHLFLERMFADAYCNGKDKPGIPIVKVPSYDGTAKPGRATNEEVYNFITSELESILNGYKVVGEKLVPASANEGGTTYLGRASKGQVDESGVRALLANAYLDMGSFTNDPALMDKVIENTDPKYFPGKVLVNEEKYLKGMSTPNEETIWSISYTGSDYNYYLTVQSFYDWGKAGYSSLRLDDDFVSTKMAKDDIRKKFIAYHDGNGYFIQKFPRVNGTVGLADVILFRYAEVVLMRAEAYARKGELVLAKTELNKIKTRAGLAESTSTDQKTLIDEILIERRLELFAEGKRVFDLKRTKGTLERKQPSHYSRIDKIENYYYAMPIPTDEINASKDANDNQIIEQNPDDLWKK
ncbi:MAG: RagB/SusD family nutrient uptake outer membrane protein [Bacteroidales bacterium]